MDTSTMGIKELAAFKGWTVTELAARSGIKTQRLYDLMRGKGTMYAFEMWALAQATGVAAKRIGYR